MKNVITYGRVSTDEQAEKGYSLRHQEETLGKYCDLKNYNRLHHFVEDYSGKNFERPEWKNLMAFVKSHKKKVDLLLFTKWDRFSRNHGEALKVIQALHKLGIEVNSSEQPLDLQQPESKIILAVYLSVPEVENDKISLRTIDGLRRARKEGVWTASPPFGYVRHWTNDDKASLKPHPKKAPLVQLAFKLYSSGMHGIEELRKKLRPKGLTLSKNQFNAMLSNPVYMGKIFIPEYKDESSQLVSALHEGLVTESMWNRVSEVRNGKKRVLYRSHKQNDTLILRQHVSCPNCGKKLTGSASTSRNGSKHYYYHCNSPCKYRVKADQLNNLLIEELSSLTLPLEIAELYKDVLNDYYKSKGQDRSKEISTLRSECIKIKETIEKAEDRFFEGVIDNETFTSAKARYTLKYENLQSQIADLKETDSDLKDQFEFSTYLLQNLDLLYVNSTFDVKTAIIGSIYPEKLKIEYLISRTKSSNSEICLKGALNGVLEGVKQWAEPKFKEQPSLGWKIGLEPTTLGTTNRCSNQLSYNHHVPFLNGSQI